MQHTNYSKMKKNLYAIRGMFGPKLKQFLIIYQTNLYDYDSTVNKKA
jgi:hypothetical protein